MAVLVAPAAFKGTLSPTRAAEALRRGLHRAKPDEDVRLLPVSDGGDGLLDALLGAAGGWTTTETVPDALGRPHRARIGWTDRNTAVVELAEACGIRDITPSGDTARSASTYGLGILLGRALASGARRVIVGLGGSASTDGGLGCLLALGAKIGPRALGAPPTADILSSGGTLDIQPARTALAFADVTVALDVDAPLLGPRGAAAVFGPQKGMQPTDRDYFEQRLRWLADCFPDMDPAVPGMGAAGGCGFGLAAAGALCVPGAPLVLNEIGFDDALRGCTLVLTGEGRLDATTARGKAPAEVARRAAAAGIPCVAVCGSAAPDAPDLFSDVVELDKSCKPMRHPRAALAHAASRAARSSLQTAGESPA